MLSVLSLILAKPALPIDRHITQVSAAKQAGMLMVKMLMVPQHEGGARSESFWMLCRSTPCSQLAGHARPGPRFRATGCGGRSRRCVCSAPQGCALRPAAGMGHWQRVGGCGRSPTWLCNHFLARGALSLAVDAACVPGCPCSPSGCSF